MIPITKPLFSQDEKDALLQAIDAQWVGQGQQVAAFEEELVRDTNGLVAVAVHSGTAALHLLLRALGVQNGDVVCLPAFSFVASANAVEYCGAKPLFVDIDLASYNMNLNELERLLRGGLQAKVVMVVHQFGLMMDVQGLQAMLDGHGMYDTRIVEDAACAAGATFADFAPGQFSTGACFSMHPRKLITAGEGGYVQTRDREIAKRIKIMRSHGLDDQGDMTELGFNYRMTDLQAGVALAQLGKLEQFVEARCQQADFYAQALGGLDNLALPIAGGDARPNWQSYVVRLQPEWLDPKSEQSIAKLKELRNAVIEFAHENGVQLRASSPAFAEFGYYQDRYGLRPMDFPVSFLAASASLALPIFPGLGVEEQQVVVDVVKKALTKFEV